MAATMRYEVVDRPDLLPAQAAFVRHRVRDLARLPRLLKTLAVVLVLLAMGSVANAVFDRGSGRGVTVVASLMTTTSLTLAALELSLVAPRSFRRRAEQMKGLRQRIEQLQQG